MDNNHLITKTPDAWLHVYLALQPVLEVEVKTALSLRRAFRAAWRCWRLNTLRLFTHFCRIKEFHSAQLLALFVNAPTLNARDHCGFFVTFGQDGRVVCSTMHSGRPSTRSVIFAPQAENGQIKFVPPKLGQTEPSRERVCERMGGILRLLCRAGRVRPGSVEPILALCDANRPRPAVEHGSGAPVRRSLRSRKVP